MDDIAGSHWDGASDATGQTWTHACLLLCEKLPCIAFYLLDEYSCMGHMKRDSRATQAGNSGTIKEQDISSCSLRAACGNRTRNSTLGRSHFTVELMPQMGYLRCNLLGKVALKVTDFSEYHFDSVISIYPQFFHVLMPKYPLVFLRQFVVHLAPLWRQNNLTRPLWFG